MNFYVKLSKKDNSRKKFSEEMSIWNENKNYILGGKGVVFLLDTLFVYMSVKDAFEYPRLGSLV